MTIVRGLGVALEEALNLANDVARRVRRNAKRHVVAVELGFRVAFMVEPARGARRDQALAPRP